MSTPHAPPGTALPAGRYGTRRRPLRGWRGWALLLAGVAFGCAVAYVGYRNLGSAPIDAERVAFDERPGNAIEMTIQVTRDDPARPGVCIVRARDRSGTEGGRREVYVPPGENGALIRTVIRSAGRPVTTDVFGCSYTVPPYLARG